jgi:hypothetical protein
VGVEKASRQLRRPLFIHATPEQRPAPLDGFVLGLAAFVFIWKTGLIDVIWF